MPTEAPFHDTNSEKNMVWLFSPLHLRKVFYEDLDEHLVKLQRKDTDEDEE